jgi:hypothetical protein
MSGPLKRKKIIDDKKESNIIKTIYPHPIYDFITDDNIDFLKNLKNGTLKQRVIILYGDGKNGKKCFVELICQVIGCTREYNPRVFLNKIQFVHTTLEKQHPNIHLINYPTTFDTLKQIGAYVICVTSVHSNNVRKSKFDTNYVKLIEFKNVYCHHLSLVKDDYVLQLVKESSDKILRKALSFEKVVDDEAISIVKKLID